MNLPSLYSLSHDGRLKKPILKLCKTHNNNESEAISILIIAICLFFCCCTPAWAQTTSKFVLNGGTLFSVNDDGSNPEKWLEFPGANNESGDTPFANIVTYEGDLYGVSIKGGTSNSGTIFKLDQDELIIEILHSFNGSDGENPTGELLFEDGYFWGMTRYGGTDDNGTIFRIKPDGSDFEKVQDFEYEINGAQPYVGFALHNAVLWGMTSSGGENGIGTIFSFNPANLEYVKYVDLDNFGASRGGLIVHEGLLWGLGRGGGANEWGTIFTFNPSDFSVNTVHDFNKTDGDSPTGELALINGKFWGTTQYGGSTNSYGTIFSIETDGTDFTKIRDFDLTNGSNPFGSLVEANGKIWGTTRFGGSLTNGVVFSLNTDGTGFTVEEHIGQFIENLAGPLYLAGDSLMGMSENVIYAIKTSDGSFNTTFTFSDGAIDGTSGAGALIYQDQVIGLTRLGGSFGNGMIYSVDNRGQNKAILHEFQESEGSTPTGELLLHEGKLYGLTTFGGDNNRGIIFSIEPDGSGFTTIHSFSIGKNPYGGLVEANGKLWGMTKEGGTVVDIYTDFGTIFNIDPDGNNFNIVYEFDRLNGNSPKGSLVKAEDKFWGVTSNQHFSSGGTGVIFSIDTLTGDNYEVHHTFETTSGTNPEGSLTLTNNKLWGLTRENGAFGAGSIYSIDLNGTNFTEIKGLDENEDGGYPTGTMIEYEGKLWGVCDRGGAHSRGTIFSINTDGTGYDVVYDISNDVGSAPSGAILQILQIVKEDQNITFELSDKVYGDDSFTLGASSDSSEPIIYNSSDENVITIEGEVASIANAGETTITATQEGNDYYIEGASNQVVTVNPTTLVITVDNLDKIYGSENPVFSATYDGLVYDDQASSLDTPPTFSTDATITSATGNYDIVLSEAEDNNYEITQTNGILTITKASLTATADFQEKFYGTQNPELTISYIGFVNEDSEMDLDTEPSISTTATETSEVGEYPIDLSSETDSNYEIITMNGILSVVPAILTATADDKTIVVGEDIPELTITYDGFVLDENETDITPPSISTGATISSASGLYNIILEGGQADNYELNLVNGVLTIEPMPVGLTDEFKMMFYPNPARNYLQIEWPEFEHAAVLNLSGKEVTNSYSKTIDMSLLNEGIYLLKITSINGRAYIFKILKK